MLTPTTLTFHRTQFQEQGFTIFLSSAIPKFVASMAAVVADAQKADLVEGDNSAHSWKEIALDPPFLWNDIVDSFVLSDLTSSPPTRMAQWLNVYETNEFIGSHVDAGGDIQLMIPIEMPPPGGGGDLWLNQKDCIVPAGIGDVLFFAASRLRHGTTAVRSGRRVSFNGRMWLG